MQDLVPILLVEDEPNWQQGVEALLSTDSRFQLVGIADHYELATQLFQQVRPQVILLDWKIKGELDGLAVGDWLINQGVQPERIILISGSDYASIPKHPFLFVPKSRLSEELLPLLTSITKP